jgi:hypothetical protein
VVARKPRQPDVRAAKLVLFKKSSSALPTKPIQGGLYQEWRKLVGLSLILRKNTVR